MIDITEWWNYDILYPKGQLYCDTFSHKEAICWTIVVNYSPECQISHGYALAIQGVGGGGSFSKTEFWSMKICISNHSTDAIENIYSIMVTLLWLFCHLLHAHKVLAYRITSTHTPTYSTYLSKYTGIHRLISECGELALREGQLFNTLQCHVKLMVSVLMFCNKAIALKP